MGTAPPATCGSGQLRELRAIAIYFAPGDSYPRSGSLGGWGQLPKRRDYYAHDLRLDHDGSGLERA